eukprot:3546351-Rhodomonas_salina.1
MQNRMQSWPHCAAAAVTVLKQQRRRLQNRGGRGIGAIQIPGSSRRATKCSTATTKFYNQGSSGPATGPTRTGISITITTTDSESPTATRGDQGSS